MVQSWKSNKRRAKDLWKSMKPLLLSKMNQHLILWNFVILWLKGFSKIVASLEIGYQWHEVWERVLCLKDLDPCMAPLGLWISWTTTAWRWLITLKAGTVTPHQCQLALNTEILLVLNIMMMRQPLCGCTARRWLLELGWWLRVPVKGVYVDGYEWEDVMEGCNEVFFLKWWGLRHRCCILRGLSRGGFQWR